MLHKPYPQTTCFTVEGFGNCSLTHYTFGEREALIGSFDLLTDSLGLFFAWLACALPSSFFSAVLPLLVVSSPLFLAI